MCLVARGRDSEDACVLGIDAGVRVKIRRIAFPCCQPAE